MKYQWNFYEKCVKYQQTVSEIHEFLKHLSEMFLNYMELERNHGNWIKCAWNVGGMVMKLKWTMNEEFLEIRSKQFQWKWDDLKLFQIFEWVSLKCVIEFMWNVSEIYVKYDWNWCIKCLIGFSNSCKIMICFEIVMNFLKWNDSQLWKLK